MTVQTQEIYDLEAIAKIVKIAPARVKFIIAELVERFQFDATKIPSQDVLVAIIGSIVGIQESQSLSATKAIDVYVKNLHSQQKQPSLKTTNTAGTMAESIDKIAEGLANQMAPKVVELAIKKLDNAILQELSKGFELLQSGNCFSQLENIIDAEIREVGNTDNNFQLGGKNVLGYFALPEGK